MKTTVKEISTWARDSISALSQNPKYKTLTAVYESLRQSTGISVSWLQKFGNGEIDNPTQNTLDKLVAALKIMIKGC